MKTYLDMLKAREGLSSDNQLAALLGITRQAVSNYRTGKSIPDDYTCARLAQKLGIDELEVIAAANAARARTDEERSFWKQFLTRAAAVLVCMVLIGMDISPAFATVANIHYAQLVEVLAVVYWFTQQPRQRQP